MIKRVMVDLETLASTPKALILSLGAVEFDPAKGLGQELYQELRWEDQPMRHVDPSTVAWWSQQSDEARKVFLTKLPGGFHREKHAAVNALEHFSQFLGEVGFHENNVEVWGYGADFDCVVLGSLYEDLGLKRPWSYSKNRCHRTLVHIAKALGMEQPPRKGTHHNALDDAKYQAECAIIVLNRLGVK